MDATRTAPASDVPLMMLSSLRMQAQSNDETAQAVTGASRG